MGAFVFCQAEKTCLPQLSDLFKEVVGGFHHGQERGPKQAIAVSFHQFSNCPACPAVIEPGSDQKGTLPQGGAHKGAQVLWGGCFAESFQFAF